MSEPRFSSGKEGVHFWFLRVAIEGRVRFFQRPPNEREVRFQVRRCERRLDDAPLPGGRRDERTVKMSTLPGLAAPNSSPT